jgi:hypothetical protein
MSHTYTKNNTTNLLVDWNTSDGLSILGRYFDLPKKLIIRQLVSEKLNQLKLVNPIKEVAA